MKDTIIGDRLTYKIDTEEPIEIKDLIKSLQSISSEYSRFSKLTDVNVKVAEVRKGSYEFDLILTSLAPILPLMADINTTTEFIKRMEKIKTFFVGNNSNKIKPTIEEAKMLNAVAQPISIVNNGTINVINGNENVSLSINKEEYKAIHTSTAKYIEENKDKKEENNNIFKDRLIHFVQTRSDNKDYGNKSICENISDKEIKTNFKNEQIKNDILNNPYHFAFLVDLEVQYINDEAKIYKIINLNNKIELTEEN